MPSTSSSSDSSSSDEDEDDDDEINEDSASRGVRVSFLLRVETGGDSSSAGGGGVCGGGGGGVGRRWPIGDAADEPSLVSKDDKIKMYKFFYQKCIQRICVT